MYDNICQTSNSRFYKSGRKNSANRRSSRCKKLKVEQVRPFRTSTPISDLENVSSSFSDSVIDFFYQIWKSGLLTDSGNVSQTEIPNLNYDSESAIPRPFCYATSHFVYVSTVIYQSIFVSSTGAYLQPVGYRPDGTFGVLPFYWPCIIQ